MRDKGSSEVVY